LEKFLFIGSHSEGKMETRFEKKNNKESIPGKNFKPADFSIVIPTFNSVNLLLRCLEALEKQSAHKSKFEVVVSDDGSSDKTVETLSEFQTKTKLNFKWTTILNSGPGNARNAGVKISSGSWIGFLDADVIPNYNWVDNSIKLIQKNPYAGAFEGCTKVSQREIATPFSHQTENLNGGRYPTCNFLVRRSLARFYSAYKIPFREDTDLAFSILESGYEIIFSPELIVEHPPLPSKYSRPIFLARRYYYDGLLARRFPYRYRLELDSHQILGIKIPHLKKKLFTIFAVSQIILLYVLTSEINSFILPSVFFYVTNIFVSAATSLRFSNLMILSLKDWLVFFVQLNIIPWIMGYSLIRGWYDFRKEKEFSKK
tara:strand:- start:262 stop:1371 length:1110 start_codon:yes stop_codon:yes gene_type:complete